MINLWTRWVNAVYRPVDARPLVWVRRLMPLVILADMLSMAHRGAAQAILFDASHGGTSSGASKWFMFGDWMYAGPFLWAVIVLSMPFISAGILTRPALVTGILAYSQLGHMDLPGDRGVDRMMRTTLIILLFSEVTQKKVPEKIAQWPVMLTKWMLVFVYLSAGMAKITNTTAWWDPRKLPELYTILVDPLGGHLDPAFWYNYQEIFIFGGWSTIILEFTPFLILTRWSPYWACFGAFMHVGIALWMDLGIFSFGMLAFYPLLFSPWTEKLLNRASGIKSTGPTIR